MPGIPTDVAAFVHERLAPVAVETCKRLLQSFSNVCLQIHEPDMRLGLNVDGFLYPLDLKADALFESTCAETWVGVSKTLVGAITFVLTDGERRPPDEPRAPALRPTSPAPGPGPAVGPPIRPLMETKPAPLPAPWPATLPMNAPSAPDASQSGP